MPDPLDPASTDAGAMERLMLLETMTPARSAYDADQSLAAMRLMRRVIENRLHSPAAYGARGATTETEVIAVGNQFAGFGDYPTLPASLAGLLDQILAIASRAGDPRQPDYAGFVRNAVTAATEAMPASPHTDAVAWRTTGHGGPGGRFRFLVTIQGNDFYAATPVPPLPRRRHRAGAH